jgi:NAD(P)-dependent dehydrogenase (short-subunit alcohol dehydrogenase family)
MTNSPFSLAGKTILVTGASSGIGYETCKLIVQLGGNIIGVARREQLLKDLIDQPGFENSSYIVADLSNEDDIMNVATKVGEIDGLVHSAGSPKVVPVRYYKLEELEWLTRINYYSVVMLVNYLLKKKKIKKDASLVMVASLAGSFGTKGLGFYAGTKASVAAISRVWANELSSMGIRVNCVSPGMVRTDIKDHMENELSAEMLSIDESKYPLGYGETIEVAAPVAFLLSSASSWISGQNIIIDGGRSIVL